MGDEIMEPRLDTFICNQKQARRALFTPAARRILRYLRPRALVALEHPLRSHPTRRAHQPDVEIAPPTPLARLGCMPAGNTTAGSSQLTSEVL
jgi:hypothetical protein